jgi:hypothetical protein
VEETSSSRPAEGRVMDKRITAAITVLADHDRYFENMPEEHAYALLRKFGVNDIPEHITIQDLIHFANMRWRTITRKAHKREAA